MTPNIEYIGQPPPNDNVKSVLENVLEENGFKDCRIDIKPFGVKGDNFIAEMYSARVEGVDDRTLNLIIKIGQENEELRRRTQTPILFRNEVLTYTETLPMYEEIQTACRIDKNKRYKFAKCYGSDLTDGKECIILENVKVQGFSMEDRLEALSYEYVNAAVENLAKYHALSFVFREKHEGKYKSVVGGIQDFFGLYARSESFLKHFKQAIERAATTVDDEYHKERLRNACDAMTDLFLNSHKPWSERICVINHGDAWSNNLLFRTENGSPLDTIIVDYQLAKHSSPVLDILYFIFLSTNSEFREQHFDNLKNTYYKSLSDFLKDLGYDVNKFYTRNEMERDIVEYSPLTLALAVLILPVITAEKDAIPDLTESSEDKTPPAAGKSTMRYEKKMGDAIRDFVKYKFI